MKRILLGVLGLSALAVGLVFVAVAGAAGTFPDVPKDHRFAVDIERLADLGIISGMEDGHFRPENPVLRQQMAKIVVLATGLHTDTVDNEDSPTFGDVTPSLGVPYPFDYIEEAAGAGLFLGDNGLFGPYLNITRVQLALVLVRAGGAGLDDPPAGYSTGFADTAGLSAEAQAAVAKAKFNALFDGKTATTFDPWAPATRGHICRMTSRLLDKIGEPGGETNLAVLHLSSGGLTNATCIGCHGDVAQQPSTDPSVLSAHAVHLQSPLLAFGSMTKGCGVCHQSVDLSQSSGGSIGKQVDPAFCLTCHGTFTTSKHGGQNWATTNPDGCSMCHGPGSALDPSAAHAAVSYIQASGNEDCAACHGGIALYAEEETN